MMRFDAHTVLGGVVFYKKLLQEEQSFPLFGFLSDLEEMVVRIKYFVKCITSYLYKTIPVILSFSSVTVRTHLISNRELHYKGLLQDCST